MVTSNKGTECDMMRTQLMDIVGDFYACQLQNIARKSMVSDAFQCVDTYGTSPYT